jgi:hypothetical protein
MVRRRLSRIAEEPNQLERGLTGEWRVHTDGERRLDNTMSSKLSEYSVQQGGTVEPSESEWHSVLSSKHRRLVLEVLEEQNTDIQLGELASEVAKLDGALDAASPEKVDRVQVRLHHMHLPKMEELGVLTYEPESHRISV